MATRPGQISINFTFFNGNHFVSVILPIVRERKSCMAREVKEYITFYPQHRNLNIPMSIQMPGKGRLPMDNANVWK